MAVALLSPIACMASSARIECWTDHQGHRACGNSVPPQYATRERDVLNEKGQIVEKKTRAPTLEEERSSGTATAQGAQAR